MRLLLLLLFAASYCVVAVQSADAPCDVTTDMIVECGQRYIDTNHNGYTEPQEIEDSRHRYLNVIERKLAEVFAPSATIAHDCGADHRGWISEHSFRATKHCIAGCADRRKFNSWICARAAAKAGDKWPPA